MKIVKSTAMLMALLFVLSCNQDVSKQPEAGLMALKSELKEAETQATDNNASFDKVEIAAGTLGNSSLFNTGDDKQQQEPEQKKDKQKQPPITTQTPKADWDKKIIKTASVNLEVKDYNSYYASLREKVKSLGGYIAQEEQNQSDYKIENAMTIKVPVDQFDNAVLQLSSNAEKINQRKISSQDVTAEVVDTKARIEAKKQVRQCYMDLLGQAKNMEEILNVQSEINGMQEEIESATGRVEYLSHSSTFSTINLTYYQVLNATAKDPAAEKSASFGEKIKGAFQTGWEIVSNLFIIIITIWPLLLGSFFAFLLYKKMRVQKPKQA
ncbi:MAG TPA: DUF4349 domain-containing protein [Chitinophagaceae bacterium]